MKILIPALLVLITINACSSPNKEKEKPATEPKTEQILTLTDAQLKNVQIGLGKLEEKNIATTIKVNGRIDVPPQNMVSVSMPMSGYLRNTKLLPGMHINKGEIIATTEDQQYIQLQQDYLTTKSKVEFYEAEHKRQLELNASKASSDKNLQQVEMEYKSAKISMKALAEKLRLININPNNLNENNLSKSVHIYAPISGFVSKVNVNVGKYLNPTDVLFELVNPDDIHLNLMVFEKDLDKLAIGQKLYAYTNNQPDVKHPCSIILISKDISPERYAEVHCHFEDYDKNLLPGMYMNAEIETHAQLLPTLPVEAIVQFEGKNFVFVAKNKNNFEMKEVDCGQQESGFVVIKNASTIQNAQIVIKDAYTLLMSLKNKAEEE